jgi:HK97 family phage major capsid protein|nr:MAG TPA: major capsid protein [Caudoviricetes sp.]
MKNKGLLIKAKLSMRNKSLEKINAELEELNKRSEETETAIEAAENDEDLKAVEEQIEEIQTELSAKKEEKENLEKEISDLEAELKELEDKEPAKEEERNMNKNEKIQKREALNAFIRSKGQTREGLKIVDGGAVVPVETTELVTKPDINIDLTKLVKVVKVKTGSGKTPIASKSKGKMVKTSELEKNPELAKPKFIDVAWTIDTFRGQLGVSQEMIDDATYDIMEFIEEDVYTQDINTKNYEIASILKTAKAESASGLDGLKDVINKKIPSVYNVSLIVTDSMFAALDKVKDKQGRYMLQEDVTSPTGYKFKGKVIYTLPDEMLGNEGELKGFIGDPKAFVTLFDRKQTTVRWVSNEIYGEILGIFSRFDTKKADTDAGVFVTYTDAV